MKKVKTTHARGIKAINAQYDHTTQLLEDKLNTMCHNSMMLARERDRKTKFNHATVDVDTIVATEF